MKVATFEYTNRVTSDLSISVRKYFRWNNFSSCFVMPMCHWKWKLSQKFIFNFSTRTFACHGEDWSKSIFVTPLPTLVTLGEKPSCQLKSCTSETSYSLRLIIPHCQACVGQLICGLCFVMFHTYAELCFSGGRRRLSGPITRTRPKQTWNLWKIMFISFIINVTGNMYNSGILCNV